MNPLSARGAWPILFDMLRDLIGSEEATSDRSVLRDLLISFERNIIVTALFAADGDQKRAARALGVLPTTFQEKLKRLGIVRASSRGKQNPLGGVHK